MYRVLLLPLYRLHTEDLPSVKRSRTRRRRRRKAKHKCCALVSPGLLPFYQCQVMTQVVLSAASSTGASSGNVTELDIYGQSITLGAQWKEHHLAFIFELLNGKGKVCKRLPKCIAELISSVPQRIQTMRHSQQPAVLPAALCTIQGTVFTSRMHCATE